MAETRYSGWTLLVLCFTAGFIGGEVANQTAFVVSSVLGVIYIPWLEDALLALAIGLVIDRSARALVVMPLAGACGGWLGNALGGRVFDVVARSIPGYLYVPGYPQLAYHGINIAVFTTTLLAARRVIGGAPRPIFPRVVLAGILGSLGGAGLVVLLGGPGIMDYIPAHEIMSYEMASYLPNSTLNPYLIVQGMVAAFCLALGEFGPFSQVERQRLRDKWDRVWHFIRYEA